MTLAARWRESRSIENPALPLTAKALVDYLDGAPGLAGVTVNENTAMGLIAVHRCVELIAGTCAALPLKGYKFGTRERVQAPVLDDPHPEMTRFETWETLYSHLLLWGNAYARKLRDGTGRVRHLWPIHPARVRVDLVDPSGGNPGGKVFAIVDQAGQRRPFTSNEVLHIPGLGYDGRVGKSRIQWAKQGLSVAMAAEEFSARFFGNGMHFAGILKTEQRLDQPKAEALKARWREKVSGLKSAGDVVVVDNGAEFQPISMPAKDAELLASRGYSTTEIARLFGLPPHAIGDVSNSTSWGTGIEQQTIGMVQFTLQPSYLARVEQRLTKDSEEILPSSVYCEYAVEGLLRGDSAARAQFNTQAIQNGWATRNEVRVRENDEPIEGGDELLLPAGVMPAAVGEMKAKVDAAGALVRAGFDPAAALQAVGLPPILHTGLVPVTVQGEDLAEGEARAKKAPEKPPEFHVHPVVNVHPAELNVHPPNVTVEPPNITVNTAASKSIERDEHGRISRVVEETV